MMRIPIDQIDPNPAQPRKRFEGLDELAASIRDKGLLESIMVRPVGGRYQIIHGERRWRACRMAGFTEVEVVVREADDAEAYELALIENLQRADLSPIEEAKAFAGLCEAGWTQQRVADLIGKSQQYVASRLVLLRLPERVQDLLTTRVVSPSHGEVLAGVRDPGEQVRLAERIAAERLSVQALRAATGATGATAGAINEGGTVVIHEEGWTFTKPGSDGALMMLQAPSGGKALFYPVGLRFDDSEGEWTKDESFWLGCLLRAT